MTSTHTTREPRLRVSTSSTSPTMLRDYVVTVLGTSRVTSGLLARQDPGHDRRRRSAGGGSQHGHLWCEALNCSAWRGFSLGLGLFMLARGLWTCAQPDIVDCRAPAAGLAAALISPNVLGVLQRAADGEFLERRLSPGPAELPSA